MKNHSAAEAAAAKAHANGFCFSVYQRKAK
jgi:hypothetical protein